MRRSIVPVLTVALAGGFLAVVPVAAQAADPLPPSGAEPFSIGNRVFLDNGSNGVGGFNPAQRDNGLQDANEVGVNGVRVELYYDANGNSRPDDGELVRFDVTAAGSAGPGRPGANLDGYYLFDDLPQGTYFVVVPASEFAVGKPLGGHHSSRFDGTESSGVAGASADPATDQDDNGREPASRRPDLDGVTSNPITFVDGQPVVTGETDLSHQPDPGNPANEVGTDDPTGWDGPGSIGRRTAGSQRDDASNVAVDFGFTPPMSIGNRIWLDDSSDPAQWVPGGSRNNAAIDATDDGNLTVTGLQIPGIADVDLQLWADRNNTGVFDSGDVQVATTTTGTNGYYLFDGLAAGDYVVRVPPSEFGSGQPLNGLVSSYDSYAQITPTNQTDSNDNGVDFYAHLLEGVTTRLIRLVPGAEATGETDPSPQVQAARGRFGETDADSDLTIDLGFARPPMSIGNQVWLDDHPTNQALRNNGLLDSGETLIAGVEVALYRDANNNGNVDAGEDTGLRDTTDADGGYLFDNLPPGNYLVAITAANFNTGGPLENMISSRSVAPNPLPADNRTDNNDNGRDTFVAGVGIISSTINLTYGAEPTNDTSGPAGRGTHGERDEDSDRSVDFGFYVPMSLGNRVWLDDSNTLSASTRNNGVLDAGDDLGAPQGVPGVSMRLYRDLNTNGVIDAGEDTGRTTTTNATGYYLFDGLPRGAYLAAAEASNFTGAGPLVGFVSSYAATPPTDDGVDSSDKGTGLPASPSSPSPVFGILSPSIVLSYTSPTNGSEPTGETDPTTQTQAFRGSNGERDAFSNLTTDFGFSRPPMSIGNQVWFDDHPTNQSLRNNGLLDAGETLIANVEVALYRDANNNGNVDAGEDTGLRDTTDADGGYLFDNLPPGNYLVAITAANFNTGGPLENMISSRSVAPNPLPADNRTDNNDNGRDTFVAGVGIISSTINLTYGAEPTNDTSGPAGRGTHGERDEDSDRSVDFGFYVPMSLGNRVWLDDSADPDAVGTTRDNAELDTADDRDNPNVAGVQAQGVAGVTVRLYRDLDADGVIDAGEDTGRTTTTNATGYYLFDGLPRGSYLAGVEASNFAAGAVLQNFRSSTNAAAPTDSGVDGTDKGRGQAASPTRPDATFGVLSPTIVLGYTSPTTGSEPTDETDPTPQNQTARGSNGERNAFSDLTVDFGFVLSEPTAANDSYSTPFATTRTVSAPGILGNDTDFAGAGLTADLVSGPTDGTLTLNADGSFTYTPDAGYDGTDSFTYRAKSGAVASATATVSLTVAANLAPTADDDAYTTPFETAKTVAAPGVLDGDTDPEGKPLSAVLESGPSKGDLTLDPDGSFTYTPDTDATGDDTFTYRADDGYATSDPATVTITIGADPNNVPVASDDSYTTPFQTEKNVTAPGVLGNDTDADDDAITAVLVTGPAHGSLTLDADGSFTYTPDAGYDGPDSFTYRAKDARRTSNLATVALTVEADTTAPVATFDAPAGPINGAIDVELEFSEPVTGLDIDDFVTSNGTASDLTGSGRSYELTLAPVSSGTVTLELPAGSADDVAGNGNELATLTRLADLDAPVVTLSAPTGPVNGTFTVTIDLSEPAAALTDADLSMTGGTATALTGSGTSYSVDVTPASDGPVTLSVAEDAVTDDAGNTSAAVSITRTADLTAPGVELIAPSGPVNAPFTVTVTFDEPVTGFAVDDLEVDNGDLSDFTPGPSGATYSVLVTPTAQGAVKVRLPAGRAFDAAGNATAATTELVLDFDSVRPTVTLSAPPGPVNGTFTVTIDLSEPAAALTDADLSMTGGTATALTGSGTSYSVDVTPASDGPVTLSVVEDAVTDDAGNTSAAASITRTADLTAPGVELIAPSGPVNAPFTVTVTFDEPVTGLTATDFTVTNGTPSDVAGTGENWTVLITPATEGDVVVELPTGAASDTAGNDSTAADPITRRYDATRPTVTLTAPAGPANGPFRVTITFSEPVTGLDAGDITADNATTSGLTGTGASYQVTVTPNAQGPVTVRLADGAATDSAGLPTPAATLVRETDFAAPTATLSTTADDPATDPSITIDVTFSEPVTGFGLADLVVTGGTVSALTGGGQAYAVTLTFDPATDGATVRLPAGAASDAAGNPSRAATDLTIAYDGAAPTLTITRGPGQPDPVREPQVVFEVTADEPVSDLDAADLLLGGTAGASTATVERTGPASFEVAVTGMSARGVVDLSVASGAVRDTAGSPSPAAGPVAIAWTTTAVPSLELLPDMSCLEGNAGRFAVRLAPDAPTTLTVRSSDPDVVPPSRVVVTGRGDGNARALVTVRPRAGRAGTAVVTLVATNVSGRERLAVRIVVGTNGRDTIGGTSRPDLVFAKGGDDVVHGGGGSDLVCGGSGDDRLYGGAGIDFLYGGSGDDLLVGPQRGDTLVGGPGRDTVVGGSRRAS